MKAIYITTVGLMRITMFKVKYITFCDVQAMLLYNASLNLSIQPAVFHNSLLSKIELKNHFPFSNGNIQNQNVTLNKT